MTFTRAMRWIAPVAILALAAAFRFWALNWPDVLVFDELYYVRDAVSQLEHGFATEWPDDDPDFNASRADDFTNNPVYVGHPPFGKWLIGLGVLAFGAGDGWGWRSATALAGVLTVAVTMVLAWRLTRRQWVAWVSGLLLAVDGVHVTMSRVSLLDGYLTLFVLLGAVTMLLDHEWAARRWTQRTRTALTAVSSLSRLSSRTRRPVASVARTIGPVWFFRPWLLVSAAIFGLASGIKWSAITVFAGLLVLTLVRDVIARGRHLRALARAVGLDVEGEPVPSTAPQVVGGTLSQTLVAGVAAIIVTCAAYLSTWLGWILTDGGWNRDREPWLSTLADIHVDLLAWHSTLTAPHSYASNPLGWPLALKPTGMFFDDLGEGIVSAISPLPNVFVTWGGALATVWLGWMLVRIAIRNRPALIAHSIPAAAAFIITGMLAAWLPWVLMFSRTAVFQFYAVVFTPFTAVALALVLSWLSGRSAVPEFSLRSVSVRGRRAAVTLFLIAVVVNGVWFWPIWSGMPVPEWVRDAHLWLPGWR